MFAFRSVQFFGKERLADLLIPRSGFRSAEIYGAKFDLDLSDFIQRRIYSGALERRESKVVRKVLRPGMTFFDVGANVGYYTALAAQAVGTFGRVFSFEPSDYAFPRLQRLISKNALTQVHAMKVALCEEPGAGVLYGGVEEDANGNHTATMVPNDNPAHTRVEIETLDGICERFGIERIDFLKIDVDGSEPRVIAGASKMLSSGRISHILVEHSEYWLQRMGTSGEKLARRIKSFGLEYAGRIGRSENCLFKKVSA